MQWRHNEHDGVSNYEPQDCCPTIYSGVDQRKHQSSASLALVKGNSPETGEFPAQMASNAEKVSIWWRNRVCFMFCWFVSAHNWLIYYAVRLKHHVPCEFDSSTLSVIIYAMLKMRYPVLLVKVPSLNTPLWLVEAQRHIFTSVNFTHYCVR